MDGLERFFAALDQNQDWLETGYARRCGDFPRASGACGPPGRVLHGNDGMVAVARPREGAITRWWRNLLRVPTRCRSSAAVSGANFFTKYGESNLLHKKMLHVSRKVHALDHSRRQDAVFLKAREEARTLVLRGQCNDPYWHGVFGGLYAPHLRTALWRSLAEAEAIADRLSHRAHHYEDAVKLDFDADGYEEIYFTSDRYAALLSPEDADDFRDRVPPVARDADQFSRSGVRKPTTRGSRTYPAGRGTCRSPFTSRRARRKRASTAGSITIAGRAIVFACCFSAGRSSIRIAARFAWKKMPRWRPVDIASWKCLPAERKSLRMQALIGPRKKLFARDDQGRI